MVIFDSDFDLKMKNRKLFLFVAALLVLIFAILNHKFYHELKKFDDYKWNKNDKAVFEFEIKDTSANYHLTLNIRYIDGFPYKNLYLKMWLLQEDLPENTYLINIPIVDEKGKYTGDVAGSYWDLDYEFGTLTFTQAGKYKIIIAHNVDTQILSLINEIGITITKTSDNQ